MAGQIHHASLSVEDFDVDRIFSVLEGYGLTVLGEAGGAGGPLQAYLTMRGPDRGGAPEGTPELYFTDPDGILLQLQDPTYCGGNGYLGDECGTVENPTGRNMEKACWRAGAARGGLLRARAHQAFPASSGNDAGCGLRTRLTERVRYAVGRRRLRPSAGTGIRLGLRVLPGSAA